MEREPIELPEDCYLHISFILKLKPGAEVIVFNRESGEWSCIIDSVSRHSITVRKERLLQKHLPEQQKLGLAFCPIKPHNTGLIIEKCTELGVTDFWPIISKFTNSTFKFDKMKMIAKGAVEQCGRLDMPTLHREISFENFVNALPFDFLWISALERLRERSQSILDIDTSNRNCGFIVGPEGGFSEIERSRLLEATLPITLATNVLRSETAAIACIASAISKSV
ncbi:MAG: 16S rRNA (uracil(1498)-N(3))-methyltransferase [Holosporales bacterium]|jgi:16S rRNA (uracil1498-N3)-methyltransferase|nr:16S rRNA (uracil(1498)-N(3))-methyltransferase [Holosporales bacterium]